MRRLVRLTIVVATSLALVLGASTAASARPGVATLGIGSTGPGVKCVQHAYNVIAGRGLATDGIYGPLTADATRDFQRFFGLSVDGLVGPDTGEAIQAIWNLGPASRPSWKNTWVNYQGVDYRCWGVTPSRT